MPGEMETAGNPSMTTMRSVITLMKMMSMSSWIMMIPTKAETREAKEEMDQEKPEIALTEEMDTQIMDQRDQQRDQEMDQEALTDQEVNEERDQ